MESRLDKSSIQNKYDKNDPKCFVSPEIEVTEEDIARFKVLYSIEGSVTRTHAPPLPCRAHDWTMIDYEDYDNEKNDKCDKNVVYWLAGIHKTMRSMSAALGGFNQENTCVALSKDLLTLIGNSYGWSQVSAIANDVAVDPKEMERYVNKIIQCKQSMLCVDTIEGLTVLNPMQTSDECVMVKCGSFKNALMGMTSKAAYWIRRTSALLDFDIRQIYISQVFKPLKP